MRGPEDGGTVTREKPGSPWEALGVGAPSKDQDRKELLVQEQGVGMEGGGDLQLGEEMLLQRRGIKCEVVITEGQKGKERVP